MDSETETHLTERHRGNQRGAPSVHTHTHTHWMEVILLWLIEFDGWIVSSDEETLAVENSMLFFRQALFPLLMFILSSLSDGS